MQSSYGRGANRTVDFDGQPKTAGDSRARDSDKDRRYDWGNVNDKSYGRDPYGAIPARGGNQTGAGRDYLNQNSDSRGNQRETYQGRLGGGRLQDDPRF